MEHSITVTDAARNFSDLVDSAYRGESTLLIRSGQPVARLVPVAQPLLLGKDLASIWDSLSHLDPKDAEEFERDWIEARSKLKIPDHGLPCLQQ